VRILSIDTSPLHEISYRYVRPGGSLDVGQLAVQVAHVDELPPTIDAIVMTSDLQARELSGDLLLAEVLAQELCAMADLELIPSTSRTGVVLAGDLFARKELDKRGGLGDVRDAWAKFASSFRWVTGVAGNHDSFGETTAHEDAFRQTQGVHYMDGDSTRLDDIQFAGIGGIIGKPTKPQRRDETDFIRCLRDLLKRKPDVCVLHQGPNDPDRQLPGEPSIRRELIAQNDDLLVVCGHSHWASPVTDLSPHVQVLNVDMRALILTQQKTT
jgi:Icc protein